MTNAKAFAAALLLFMGLLAALAAIGEPSMGSL